MFLKHRHGIWVHPVGLRVLKLAPAYWEPRKPSVQVKTWTSAEIFLLTAAMQRPGRTSVVCWKCDLPRRMLLFHVLYPRSPSVLLCPVTRESDQLNPDHQLCLTYFIFGTLGFLAFHFCSYGISVHEVWPRSGSRMFLSDRFHQHRFAFIHVTHGNPGFRPTHPLQLAGFKLVTLQLQSRFCKPKQVEPWGV